MGQVQIMEMKEEDAAAVAKIDQACIANPWNEKLFLQSLSQPGYFFLVARLKDQIVGYCGLLVILDGGEILNIAVLRPFRRQGIAAALLEKIMALGRREGAVEFSLEVRSSNHAAIALYRRLGFRRGGVRRGYYRGPLEDADIMWKRE